MANSIKYNTGTEANALRTGNFHMGVGDASKGPTSTTGYYSTVNPPPGGYTIYVHNKNIGPSIQIASNDAQLIRITNTIASTSYTTIDECFQYFSGEVDKMVVNRPMDFIITDGLVFYVNANMVSSYPRSGQYWNDLGGSNTNGVLTNSPTFNSNGYFDFDGTDDIVDLGSSATSLVQGKEEVSMGLLFKLDALGSLRGLIGTLNYGCSQNLGLAANTTTLSFYNDTTSCYSVGVGGVETGKWIYGVGTYDGTTTRVYIIKDGVLNQGSAAGTKSGATNTFSSAFRVMGPNHSYRTNGQCANAFVYDKTLSESEILQNYYQAPIVTDGLVFAVDAGNLVSYENGDTTTNSLTGSSTGTLTNGVGFGSDNGGTWEFDGTDDYINMGTGLLNLQNASFSLEAWIKWDGGSEDTFFGYVYASAPNQNIHWRIYPSGALRFDFYANSINSSAGSIVVSEWTHLLVTYDYTTDNCVCYKNGNILMQGSAGPFTGIDASSTAYLGSWGSNAQYYGGDLSTFKAYNKALTAEEVMQNYSAGKGRFSA